MPPTFLSEEAHEAWCDANLLPDDAVPVVIDDEEPTARIEHETMADVVEEGRR